MAMAVTVTRFRDCNIAVTVTVTGDALGGIRDAT